VPLTTVIKENTYFDSVSLMAISSKANMIDGVRQAFVAMGTPMNKEVLRSLDLLSAELETAANGDLMIVLESEPAADPDVAYAELEGLLTAKAPRGGAGPQDLTYRTLATAAKETDGANLAVIAVNGAYAAREARTALEAGLHVMLFSDNVAIEDEVALKRLAHDNGLLMMGPDCGTAIVGGIALCFANAVRPGNIGIVAASGTGSQEVSVRIHGLGGGVSQLIGTGGRDLSERVGGIMMLDGIRALQADPRTDVIVLVSKPPARAVEEKVLAAVQDSEKPVVVCFIGGSHDAPQPPGGALAATTSDAARAAVRLAGVDGRRAGRDEPDAALVAAVRAKLGPRQRFIRGLYCGGTLCDEAMHLALERYDDVRSNVATDPAHRMAAHDRSAGHAFLDLGDDDFTNGRPHPMIDPTTRIARFLQEAADPEVGVVLMDFILGYGSHEDPAGVMLPAIAEARARAAAEGRHLEIVGYVLGTDLDRPSLREQVEKLERAGVTVAASSAEAGLLAREIVRTESPR
jgi:succinyl-CoA synthetase alpha subunit